MLTQIRRIFTHGILRVLFRFARDGVRGRVEEIVFTQESFLSIAAGFAFAIWGQKICADSAKLSDFSLGFLGYAAIALGFCVGATTVALTLPERSFLLKLATTERKSKPGDALSGLLFIFCWTAVVHWFVIVWLIILLTIFGHCETVLFVSPTPFTRALGGLTVSACSYALMQFLITVLTLWQAGTAFIHDLRQQANASTPKDAAM